MSMKCVYAIGMIGMYQQYVGYGTITSHNDFLSQKKIQRNT